MAQTDEEAVSREFISNYITFLHVDSTQDTPAPTNTQEEAPILSAPLPAPTTYTTRRRATKDNNAYKRLSKILKDCYRSLTGEKVPEEVRKHSCKENYFLMVATLLERKGKLAEAESLFQQAMTLFAEQIEEDLAEQPEYLQHLRELIPRHERALFCYRHSHSPVDESMRVLYDFENMRQKGKFYKAKKEVEDLRKEHGLAL